MSVLVALPKTPSRLLFDPVLSDLEFEALCAANAGMGLERTREGTIVVNPPAGFGSSKGNTEIIHQLTAWWKTHHRGEVLDSSGGVFLPDGSAYSPDAAYLTEEQIAPLGPEDDDHFLHIVPAFIIELRSKTDTLPASKRKMEAWLRNGVQLGWLVDPPSRSVLIYEPGRKPRPETGSTVHASGPAEGFVLDLNEVWRRYKT